MEGIVREIDALENELLVSDAPGASGLEQLVALRRRISQIRTIVVPHHEVFERLTRPELDLISSSQSAAAFRLLAGRVDGVVDALESAREMLLGSFDILMTRTGQRTNDVVKGLTIVSVVLLPSTLIASVLGMNFHPTFFDRPDLFWVAVAVIAALMATATVGARRLR